MLQNVVEETEVNLRCLKFYTDFDLKAEYRLLVLCYIMANEQNEDIGLITRLRVCIKRFEREMINRFVDETEDDE